MFSKRWARLMLRRQSIWVPLIFAVRKPVTSRVPKTNLVRQVSFWGAASVLLSFFGFSVDFAVGLESSQNFIVLVSQEAPPDFAVRVLARAETFRREIAEEWFGESLPPSVGRAILNVNLSETDERGLTWDIDDSRRTLHTVYLTASIDEALGSLLRHEIAHVVLATQYPFPHRLPAWLEEGIASRYDNDARRKIREQVLRWMARSGNWADLDRVLAASSINAQDEVAYGIASSLVEYLLAQGSKQQLLRFAAAGNTEGWDQAVHRAYRFVDVENLQNSWQAWVSERHALALAELPRPE